MKTMARRRSVAVVMAWTIRRVKKSQRVADRAFQVSFVFMMIAICSGNWMVILSGMAFVAAAGKHLDNVERNKR